MVWRGNAALIAWHDITPGAEAEHDRWHCQEHLEERVRIPGFHRGRRYRAIDSEPAYLIAYEVDDLDVLTSDAYLDRLNAPTEWTRQVVPTIRNMCRTICRVVTSQGRGVGGRLLSIRLPAEIAAQPDYLAELVERIPEIAGADGVTAAHLMAGDTQASSVRSDEMQLRGGDQPPAALALLIEGYNAERLRDLPRRFQLHDPAAQIGLYRLAELRE